MTETASYASLLLQYLEIRRGMVGFTRKWPGNVWKMYRSETISVSVAREADDLYEAFWRPECFTSWASGLSKSVLRRGDDGWHADGPEGPITIRFSDHNAFGVMDHWVVLADGRVVYIPLRVIPNDAASLVMLTLFQFPDMSDEQFGKDADWVRRDLETLKSVAEQGGR
ncbi:MAG: polyketide cyclase [Thalassobaculaceae bacterium]|nr:polyketide cyclase [Thalassobaculaceae bacterium]